MLTAVGARLRNAVDADDLVVRLGGDEFAVVTGPLGCADAAAARARAAIDAIMAPLEVDDLSVAVGVSVGIALFDEDGETIEELLRAADQAMYAAKASGTGQWRASTPEGSYEPGFTRQLLADLEAGVPADQIVVHYQPQVQMSTSTVVGFEALARWDHPEHGLLLPAQFIPLAERSGLMAPITTTVLERALGDLPALQAAAPHARLSINVTRRHILGRGLVDDLRSRVHRHGLSPRHVVIEITEPVTRTSSETSETFGSLSRRGFEVSIRGFGTARSSLTALWSNPAVREVKVDPSIVQTLHEVGGNDDAEVTRLVRALTSAAHGLGIRVVAEGVETAQTAVLLQELGCDIQQGFWLNPPAGIDQVVAWNQEWRRQRVHPV